MPAIKNYRADLRSKYPTYIKISLVLSLLFIIIAFKLAPENSKSTVLKSTDSEIIMVENIERTDQPDKPPDLPKPVIPEIAIADDIEDVVFDDVSIDYNEELVKVPEKQKERIVEDENEIFIVVEEYPEPFGGMAAILNKLYYPELSRRAGIEGKVIISAIIDKEGNVINAEVFQSLFAQLDEAALNAIKNTKFIPGKQRGKPVNVSMKIPIQFKLK